LKKKLGGFKSVASFKKQVQKEFNKMIASGKPCVRCGQTFPVMHCSHIHSIGAYPNLRFDIMNVFPMDARCHTFWWHDEPGEAWPWFVKTFPGRYQYLLEAKNKHVQWTFEKLEEIRKAIKNKDAKKLLILPEKINP